MADSFDPSPRSAKRRKITTYGANRSSSNARHEEDGTIGVALSTDKRRSSRSKQQLQKDTDPDHDSAYGSKEDSLMEGEEGSASNGEPVSQTNALSIQDSEDAKKSGRGSSRRQSGRREKNGNTTVHSQQKTEARSVRNLKRPNGEQNLEGRSEHDAQMTQRLGDNNENLASFEIETERHGEEMTNSEPRASSRTRRKPRRFSNADAVEEQVTKTATPAKSKGKPISIEIEMKATPKGILTPSKQPRTGPRKSVAFDQNDTELEKNLGFKDISSSTKKQKLKAAKIDSLLSTNKQSTIDPIESDVLIAESEFMHEPIMEDIVHENEDDLASQQLQSGLESVSRAFEHPQELLSVKQAVLSRMVSYDQGPLTHLKSQYDTIHGLLSATVREGESNSMLLLGGRGVGKSLLLETALKDLEMDHGDSFHVVRLNGFFQTDDRLALREIWRQLGREMQVDEEETGEVSSYADIMASLLTLFSHPDEMDTDTGNLDGGRTTTKSVVIILDEFDLFTTHPRQTLLYNLFDIAQSRKAPIAVIGCSTRMDVVDCLEKRVKSRYSHRWAFIPSAKSFATFMDMIQNTLLVDANGEIGLQLAQSQREWQSRWNDYVKTSLILNNSVQALLKQTFYTNKSVPDALTALYPVIAALELYPKDSTLTTSSPSTLDEAVLAFTSISAVPNLLNLLTYLPPVHVALLCAAARLDTIHHLSSVNFNLVHTHYSELIQRSRLQASIGGSVAVGPSLRLWTRSTCRGAWEELVQRAFLIPVSAKEEGELGVGGGNEGGDEAGSTRMFRVDVTLEEIEWAVKERKRESTIGGGMGGMAEIINKWCSEI